MNTSRVLKHSNIELRFSCNNLLKSDLLTNSDPQIVVFEHNKIQLKELSGRNLSRSLSFLARTFSKTSAKEAAWQSDLGPSDPDAWLEIGRTEIVKDHQSPKFITKISLPFIFEEKQLLRFVVIDTDGKSEKIEDNDFLGYYETSLSSIVNVTSEKKSNTNPLKLANNTERGTITISAREIADESRMNVKLKFSAQKLDAKDFYGYGPIGTRFVKLDPFFVITRVEDMSAVYKSKAIINSVNPDWEPVVISMNDLCGGKNLNAPLLIEVFGSIEGKEPILLG
ncbi:Copine-1, partial [Nowakowskiella sp. JEL0078]